MSERLYTQADIDEERRRRDHWMNLFMNEMKISTLLYRYAHLLSPEEFNTLMDLEKNATKIENERH